jgi:hypothetical protein
VREAHPIRRARRPGEAPRAEQQHRDPVLVAVPPEGRRAARDPRAEHRSATAHRLEREREGERLVQGGHEAQVALERAAQIGRAAAGEREDVRGVRAGLLGDVDAEEGIARLALLRIAERVGAREREDRHRLVLDRRGQGERRDQPVHVAPRVRTNEITRPKRSEGTWVSGIAAAGFARRRMRRSCRAPLGKAKNGLR